MHIASVGRRSRLAYDLDRFRHDRASASHECSDQLERRWLGESGRLVTSAIARPARLE